MFYLFVNLQINWIFLFFFSLLFFSFVSFQISIRVSSIIDFIVQFVDEIMYEKSMFYDISDMNASMYHHVFIVPNVQNVIDKVMHFYIIFVKNMDRLPEIQPIQLDSRKAILMLLPMVKSFFQLFIKKKRKKRIFLSKWKKKRIWRVIKEFEGSIFFGLHCSMRFLLYQFLLFQS